MLVKPNWEIFKAKFSENPQDNFEWLCYLLFSKEYHQPYGTHRYKNQSGIETDPIEVDNEVIGWQSKFYSDSLSNHKEDLLGTLTKTKRDNPNITKIILYTNSEWGQGVGTKEPQAKIDTEEKAKELNIDLVWMVKSNFEIYCQEERNLNISRYFFELNTKWELTNNGFKDTLRYCYLKNFKTISLLDEKKKRVSDIFVNLAIIKEQKEEKTKDKLLNRETFLSSYEEIHKLKEPIEIKELINTSKKSLIYGKAGVGKTTLCKYIAYKWAKGELYNKFEYVVYILLRKWDSTQLKEVIRSHYYSQYKEEIDLDIKENSNKILFLFDGYDELKLDKRDGLHKAIRDNNLTNYIITTRPYGYQKSDFRVDEYFKTIGFTDEDVEKYVDAFFKKNNDKAKSLKAYLETNISIKHIGYIPLILEMICSQWKKKEFNESLTMTELYTQSIENIFFEYTEKNGTAYIQDKEEEIFNYLGKIAFEGLKQQTIVLDKKIIKEKRSFFSDYVLKAGFLNDGKAEKSNPLLNSYQFPHLTFQEYFSALYISKLSEKKQKKIIQEWKFYPHMQMFFAFLGGLIEDKEFLLKEIGNEPIDLIGIYIFNLTTFCLQEIKSKELKTKRKQKIFQQVFSDLKVSSSNFEINSSLLYISHLINNNFMKIFIEESKHENIQVYTIVSKLLERNNELFYLFKKYFENKHINDKFRKELLSVLNHNKEIFNQDYITNIFLKEEDNSIIQEKLLSILLEIGKENSKNSKNNKAIVDVFIKKFEIINWNKKVIFFLAQEHKRSKQIKKLFINSINKSLEKGENKNLIEHIAYSLRMMNKEEDNNEIIKIFIFIIQEKKFFNEFKANIALSILEIEDNVDSFLESLIELIHNETIEIYDRVKIASYLMFRNLNEEGYKDFFISLLSDRKIKNKFENRLFLEESNTPISLNNFDEIRRDLHIVDESFNTYKYNFESKIMINLYIDIIKNFKIEDTIKRNITKLLFNSCPKVNKKIIETFFSLIQHENINSYQKKSILYLLLYLAKVELSIFQIFYKIISFNSIDNFLKENIIKYLQHSGYDLNNLFCIKILILFLEDNSLNNEYRRKVFSLLIRASKNYSVLHDKNKIYIEKLLFSLKETNDKVLKELFLNEEQKKKEEEIWKQKKSSTLSEIETNKPKASLYIGGKPMYPPKFNKNEIVTKEKILQKIKEADKFTQNGSSILEFLESIETKNRSLLIEIIEDNDVYPWYKRNILINLSSFLKKDKNLKEKFKDFYFLFYKDRCDVIIDAFINIKEVDFFLDILEKNKYDKSFTMKVIPYLLKDKYIENKLIELSIKNKKFFKDLEPYMDFKLKFKAYDKGLDISKNLEKILNSISQRRYLGKIVIYI